MEVTAPQGQASTISSTMRISADTGIAMHRRIVATGTTSRRNAHAL